MGKRTAYGICKKTGKRKFYKERDAKTALGKTGKTKDRRHLRRECRHYYCPDCGGWHLTSQD